MSASRHRHYGEGEMPVNRDQYEELIRDVQCPTCRGSGRVPKGASLHHTSTSLTDNIDAAHLASRVRSEVARQSITMAIFSAACFGATQSFLSNLLKKMESQSCKLRGALLRHVSTVHNFLKQPLSHRMQAYRTASCERPPDQSIDKKTSDIAVPQLSDSLNPIHLEVLNMFAAQVSVRPTAMDMNILSDVLHIDIQLVKDHFSKLRGDLQREVMNERVNTVHVCVDRADIGVKLKDKSVQVTGGPDLLTRALVSSGLEDVVKGTYTPAPPTPVYLPSILPVLVPVKSTNKMVSTSMQTVERKTKRKRRKLDADEQKVTADTPTATERILASFCPIRPKGVMKQPAKIARHRRKKKRARDKVIAAAADVEVVEQEEAPLASPTRDLLDLGLGSELPLFPADVEAFLCESSGVDLSEILLGATVEQSDVPVQEDEDEDERAVRNLLHSALNTPPPPS